MKRIGIIIGEISGDELASSLIIDIKKIIPKLKFMGILGPKLKKLGGLEEGGPNVLPGRRLADVFHHF